MSTTGYGDVQPVALPEVFLAMLFMFAGLSTFAILISSAAELLTQSNAEARTAAALRDKMGEVQEWMARRGLPTRLRRAITAYYSEVFFLCVWLKRGVCAFFAAAASTPLLKNQQKHQGVDAAQRERDRGGDLRRAALVPARARRRRDHAQPAAADAAV